MGLKFSGGFTRQSFQSFSIQTGYKFAWMGYMGLSDKVQTLASPLDHGLFKIPDVAPSTWFTAYNGSTDVLRSGAVSLSTSKYDTTQDTNPALWFTKYDSLADVTRASSVYPSTSVLKLSRDMPDSAWLLSYNGTNDPAVRPGATYPSTFTYNTSRTVPADTGWFTNYSGANDPAVRAGATYPSSAKSAS